MSDGIGSLPTFAMGGTSDLSPDLLALLQSQAQPQMQPQMQPQAAPQMPMQGMQDVPPGTPPGFSGYNPPTPPTGVPTGVVQPGAQGLASAALNALGPSSAQAAEGGGYVNRVFGAESSGGNNYAKNPNSSATGAGQFIDSTWLNQVRKNRPDLAGLPDGQILSLRSDGNLSRQMTEAYGNENGAKLSARGLPVNDGTKYLAHFAGPQGAIGLLSADPSTPVSQVLQPGQISANPFLRGWTAGQVVDWAAKKMNGGGGGGSSMANLTPGTAAPNAASLGSTAMRGGFGLSGIVGQGPAVPGQASPTPGVASLSSQPLTAAPAPSGAFSMDAAAQQPASPYGGLMNQLQGAAGALGKAGQQGQQKGGGGMQLNQPSRPSPIGLQQAKALFDPGRFYGMLQAAGVQRR